MDRMASGNGLSRQRSSGLLKTLTGDQKSEGLEKLKEKIRQQRLAQEKAHGGGGAGAGNVVVGVSGDFGVNGLGPADLFQFRGNQYLNSFGALSNDEEFHRSPYPPSSSTQPPSKMGATGGAISSSSRRGSSSTAVAATAASRVGGDTASAGGGNGGTHVHFSNHVTSHFVDRGRSVTVTDGDGHQIKSRKTGS